MTRNELKLKLLERVGINVFDCTADEWLALAEDAERARIAVGPSDPAYEYFFNRTKHYLEAAVLRDDTSN